MFTIKLVDGDGRVIAKSQGEAIEILDTQEEFSVTLKKILPRTPIEKFDTAKKQAREHSESPDDVMVFNAEVLSQGIYEKFRENGGILTKPEDIDPLVTTLLNSGQLYFVNRAMAEQEPAFKQVIPYVILTDDQGRVFSYQRTKKGGETRLHGKWSIGVGGHINRLDREADETTALANGISDTWSYWKGLARELAEEVGIQNKSLRSYKVYPVKALIYDDREPVTPGKVPVGHVHFGIVHILKVDLNEIDVFREDTMVNPLWSGLPANIAPFEGWSQLVINAVRSKFLDLGT